MKILQVRFSLLLIILSLQPIIAQNTFLNSSDFNRHTLNRLEIQSGSLNQNLHLTSNQFRQDRVLNFLSKIKDSTSTNTDQANIQYLLMDNWEAQDSASQSKKSFLKHFYRTPSDFFHVKKPGLVLRVNPVIHGSIGHDSQVGKIFLNTRGIELRGAIDNKIGFYTLLTDNQAILPRYVEDQISVYKALPGQNFWKRYNGNGVDYLMARGYITFHITKHIDAQFGTDKNFIGNGYRSLILSDYAGNYPFLKINTQVWKIQYTNIFAQLTDEVKTSGVIPVDGLYPKKYLAFHRAGVNIGGNLNIGLFESIMFSRKDSLGNGSFDLAYLNPILFYRSAEQNQGSHDNALLGLDFKWNLLKTFSLYGQLVLDEFLLAEVKAGNGWWANKQSFQLGMNYINAFGINNLDLQGEVNYIRPYMYSHNASASYSHFNQALAHPNGANLYELVGIVRYQPTQKLNIVGKALYIKTGLDTLSSNYGGNILLDNRTRNNDYGNEIAQGVTTNIFYLDLKISYMLKHNLFIEAQQIIRKQTSSLNIFSNNTSFSSFGIRWNIVPRKYEF